MENVFSQRLLGLLEEKKMTQRELASKVGVQEATISRYVKEHRNPHSVIISKIAEVLGTTTDYLIGYSNSPEKQNIYSVSHDHFSAIQEEFNQYVAKRMEGKTPEQQKEEIELAKIALQIAEEMRKKK
jgi:transcriptional regulator with XRE-family HTH domain